MAPSIDHFHLPAGFLLAGIAVLLLAAVAGVLRTRKPWLARIRPKALMTDNEAAFFLRLERALPGYRIFPQVSFAAFLTDDGKLDAKKRWAVRARFDRKIADFVVCERETMRIIALVELDDRTHEARADRRRDELTDAAGYKTLRFQSKQKPTEAEIAARFRELTAPAGDRAVSGKPTRAASR